MSWAYVCFVELANEIVGGLSKLAKFVNEIFASHAEGCLRKLFLYQKFATHS